MRIENDVKLDFSDVLIRPKRSTLNSRSQVSLSRKFTFLNSGNVTNIIPVMAANMDGVGTFEMAERLANHNMFTCLTKHYPKYELKNWIDSIGCNISDYWAYSMGISDLDYSKFDAVYEGLNSKHNIKNVCIDVANGYTESFVEFIKKFRDTYPTLNIIAGNVATPEMVEELLLSGVDVVKVGIGSGCFVPGTIVNTINGSKFIENIKIGDFVKTHKGNIKKVIDVIAYNNDKKIVSINGIRSTDNHEYYVIEKKYKNIITDENIHDYAKWVEAKNITKDHLLIKHK